MSGSVWRREKRMEEGRKEEEGEELTKQWVN